MPHLTFSILLAILISTATALLGNRSGRERLYVAAYLFVGCVATTVAGSWIVYLIHG